MNDNKKTIIITISALAIGILLGWLIFGGTAKDVETQDSASLQENHDHGDQSENQTWTCSMHPNVRKNEPGDCPICGMELIPAESDEGDREGIDPSSIRMSPTAMKLANVSTARVGYTKPVKDIRLTGKVEIDERRLVSQSSHIPGRVERLMVDYTGDYVKKGEILAYMYSPDLVTAQEELLEAQKTKASQPQMFEAAKGKLKNWKLTDQQIEEILASGEIKEEFPILTDVSGYVTSKKVNRGDYIPEGKVLYEIADLSKVWVLFDVYESETRWINKGDTVDFTVKSFPGENFQGVVSFIDPVVDPNARVAKARVEVRNSNDKLKPEMFVSGTVKASLPDRPEALVVPKSAVMWTGERSVVYVKNASENEMRFLLRTVSLGPSLGDSYIVEDGLREGEEIAVHGTFSIDAAAQLAGKPSMMSPEGGEPATGHDHGDMSSGEMENMEDETTSETTEEMPDYDAPKEFKKQLTALVDQYIEMKDAMVASNAGKTAEEAQKTLQALENTDMKLLEGDAHMFWMENLDAMEEALKTIRDSDDLGTQRKVFVDFNPILFKKVKAFGLDGKTVYYQFCPMANNDQGAYWLSTEENIRNPYYGDMMLECGEVREVIE